MSGPGSPSGDGPARAEAGEPAGPQPAAGPAHGESGRPNPAAAEQGAPAPGRPSAKPICLALQGGGSHGAFTWGVLDRFLEHGGLSFDAVAGTSAGGVNAVALVDGLIEGGPEGARAQLARVWRRVSELGGYTPAMAPGVKAFLDGPLAASLAFAPGLRALLDGTGLAGAEASFARGLNARLFGGLTQVMSPYQFNPLNLINPLRDILDAEIDFERLRGGAGPMLFLCATDVRTGRIKVFEKKEITRDHVLASAALPEVSHAVEIEGRHYWDGGYMGNPALFPLFYREASDDVLLVQVNPIEREDVPKDPRHITERVNEISFNATLLREFRAIRFVQDLVDRGVLPREQYKRVRMHRVGVPQRLVDYGSNTKLDTDWGFLTELRDMGRDAASAWLEASYDAVGHRETLDLAAEVA